jgi:hypothetical protein
MQLQSLKVKDAWPLIGTPLETLNLEQLIGTQL